MELKLYKTPNINLEYQALKLATSHIHNPTPIEVSETVCAIRNSKLPDPKKIGNAGSFFKNPTISSTQLKNIESQYPEIPYHAKSNTIKIPAAWLIDTLNYKGKRVGDAGVHPKHALVLVNYGNASGQEILQLAQAIQNDVYQKFDIQLEYEVNII